MDKVKKGLNNQTLGFLPLVLFIILDSYFSYTLSFTISFFSCVLCLILYHLFVKERIYLLSIYPTTITFILYSIFLIFRIQPLLSSHSSLLLETLAVIVLGLTLLSKKSILARIRNSGHTMSYKTILRSNVNEFYSMATAFTYIFGIHLLVILLYIHTIGSPPGKYQEFFLYRGLPIILGVGIIVYDQIRVTMMRKYLQQEVWLPILNDKGRVIGSMAQAVSFTSNRKYFHPIVRIVILYKGMLFLTKRSKNNVVSPDLLDYPFDKYVIFRHSIESTVKEALGSLRLDHTVTPHFLLRYTFENENVKTFVSLYAVRLETEEQLQHCKNGKLWTPKQIEENLDSNIFSEYFIKEFPYLQNTILLADSIVRTEEE